MEINQSEFEVSKTRPSNKVKVLNEETYTKKLESIIKRDFFPDVENLRSDLKNINDLNEESSGKSSRPVRDSPATFETPVNKFQDDELDIYDKILKSENAEFDSGSDIQKEETKGFGIDEFMSKYTSEDNESFKRLMREDAEKTMRQHSWMYEGEEKHNIEHIPNLSPIPYEEQEKNKVLSLTGKCDKDSRPLSLENWKYKTWNPVMFNPDGVLQTKRDQIENSKLEKKEVIYKNTRFKENPFTEVLSSSVLQDASASYAFSNEGKVGIDGKEFRETPKISGYKLLGTPLIRPGVDCSPLMTWGEIESTPFQLQSNTPFIKDRISTPKGPSYQIPKSSVRDELLLKLSEQKSENHRNRKQKALLAAKSNLKTPKLSFSTRATSSLQRLATASPAMKRLLSSQLRATNKSLRDSYTPTPSTRSKFSTTPTPKSVFKTPITPSTPFCSSVRKYSDESNEFGVSLTDDLLNLPTKDAVSTSKNSKAVSSLRSNDASSLSKRKCAADYF